GRAGDGRLGGVDDRDDRGAGLAVVARVLRGVGDRRRAERVVARRRAAHGHAGAGVARLRVGGGHARPRVAGALGGEGRRAGDGRLGGVGDRDGRRAALAVVAGVLRGIADRRRAERIVSGSRTQHGDAGAGVARLGVGRRDRRARGAGALGGERRRAGDGG